MEPVINEKIQSVIERFDAPFFFYNLDALKEHLEYMKDGLDPDIKLWYACKANPMSAVIKILRNLGFGIDVASSGELHQVLNTGVDPQHVLATGPGKSKEYLQHLIKNGVKTIVLESINQAYWLDEIVQETQIKVDCLLRIQLEWNEGKSVLGGDEITPFGISTIDWKSIDRSKIKNLSIKGFHVFQWGNILEVNKLEQIWRRTIEEAKSLASDLDIEIKVLDLGGGLGIPYNFTDKAIDFKDVQKILFNLKNEYKLKEIWMELGRFTVGDCGYYLNKIVDRKNVRGRDVLVCEGGINHIARVALVNQAFPATSFKQSNAPKQEFHIHGPLCTALDFLGSFELPSDIGVGDWLMFHKAGAYGFTESMPYFLCHKLAGEVIYYNGDLMIPRPPKTSYDWMI
jgi:diaminopimelate decarboxylase